MPSLRVQPGCSFCQQGQGSVGHRTPLPPACPLPIVCSYCLAQLGTEGTLGWRYWCQGGPHLLQLSTIYRWLQHPASGLGISFTALYTLTISPQKCFLLFCRTALTQEVGDWGLRSSHVGKGHRKKNPSGNYGTQRTSREMSLVFSCFQKTPWCFEFSGVHLEIYQSNLFFQTAELFSSGNQTSLPHLY